MVEIPFYLVETAFAAVWLAARIVLWILRGWIDWKREAVLLLMYVNLAVLIRFTFFPMDRADGRVQPLVFDAAAAFPKGYIHVFGDDALGIEACRFQTADEFCGYLACVFPFKQSLVGTALAGRVVAVTVVD